MSLNLRITLFAIWLLLGLLGPVLCSAQVLEVGRDVAGVFARATNGAPLRYVAIGGSITQAGEGWVGGWLREQFPQSQVMTVNSGISGTGSSLAVFRVERDVIAYQPDLVAIEFCVNDLGLPDEDAIRYLESLVARLKCLPQPPAIMILEAATRNGVNLARHRRVAQHYGLLEVDLQEATTTYLKTTGLAWTELFGDAVHPKKEGHALYRAVIEKTLHPYVDEAHRGKFSDDSARPLPAPLSTKPLVLDGRMVPLQALREASGQWAGEPPPQADWARFFQGVLSASEPGAVLQIPFRGTAVGVFFAMYKDYGSFYMNVDGGLPKHVPTNIRNSFSSVMLSADLVAREHLFTLVLPALAETGPEELAVNGPVKLGYLLVAGETTATREKSPQGPFDTEALKNLRFEAVPASAWSWTGPFLVREKGRTPVDAQQAISKSFLGEKTNELPPRDTVREWRAILGEGSLVDLRKLTGAGEPAIAYAEAQISSAAGGEAILTLDVDYYAQIWLNGELVLTMDRPHPRPIFLSATLRPGLNSLMCKVGAGSDGFSIQLRVAELAPKNNAQDRSIP